MSQGSEQSGERGEWTWLTNTWVGPTLSLIGLVSAPLAFVESRAFVWTSCIAAIATTCWWCNAIFNAWEPKTLFGPKERKYSRLKIGLWLILPACCWAITSFFLFSDIGQLNVWRRNFPGVVVDKVRCGTVNKYFVDTAPRTTLHEREEYERSEWIRLLDAGVSKQHDKATLLFISTKEFKQRFHTFSIEVHDPSKQVRPCSTGIAFLVKDQPSDVWSRRLLRQIPCDLAGDGDSRLFRILAENPNPDEYLWLFMCVTSANEKVDLDALNLQLMVRQ